METEAMVVKGLYWFRLVPPEPLCLFWTIAFLSIS